MNNTIYIIIGEYNDCDIFIKWNVKAFTIEQDAINFCKIVNRWTVKNKNADKCPYDINISYNYKPKYTTYYYERLSLDG